MNKSLYDISLEKIDGGECKLRTYEGSVLLVVNVASKCGLTPQYEGLERLYEKYGSRKFTVLGFPANDFAGQEPGSNEEIKNFCTMTYGVRFPMFAKIKVTGDDKHPLYQYLVSAVPETEDRDGMENALRGYKIEPTQKPEVLWNFEKFLIDRQGQVVRRFAPDTLPEAAKVLEAIEALLSEN